MHRQRRLAARQPNLVVTATAPDRAQSPKPVIDVHQTQHKQTKPVNINKYQRSKTNLDAQTHSSVPDELGKFAFKLKEKLSPNDFYDLVAKIRGRHELNELLRHSHAAAPLLNHLRKHGAPVVLRPHHSTNHISKQLRKGAHPTARRKADFFRSDVRDQIKRPPSGPAPKRRSTPTAPMDHAIRMYSPRQPSRPPDI